jgi:hypothetical protein
MTHDQIDRMVRKANPLPDLNALEPVDVPVLTTPLERRMEMQTDNRVVTDGDGQNRRRGPLVGIAAAAAVIVIAGLIFYLNRDNTPVAEPAPNASEIIPEEALEAEAPLAPGAYFVDTDGDEASSLRGTFVIEGSGWDPVPSGAVKVGEGEKTYVMLLVLEVDEVFTPVCPMNGQASVAAGSTAEDLANQVAASGFTVREALTPVNAFAHAGHHLVREVPEGCAGDSPKAFAWTGGAWDHRYYQAPGQVVEDWFLDVEGTPVMVEATWFPDSPEEDVTELSAVLDTLVFTP